jgi:hypothetical protein
MSYCIPVFSYSDTGTETVSASYNAPDAIATVPNICFPTFLRDTDRIHVRIGWKSTTGRGIKIWLVDPSEYSMGTSDFDNDTAVLASIDLTSTATDNASYPVSEGSISAGVTCTDTSVTNGTFASHIRANGGCHCYVGAASSGSGGASYISLDIWIEGNEADGR